MGTVEPLAQKAVGAVVCMRIRDRLRLTGVALDARRKTLGEVYDRIQNQRQDNARGARFIFPELEIGSVNEDQGKALNQL